MDFVVTPTYNECNNIRVLIERIFSLYPNINVLVVDDNSPDGTSEVVRDLQKKYGGLYLKQRGSKLGLASAYLESFKFLLKEFPSTKNIISIDADLSHDPKVIGAMLKEMQENDLVIGSRYMKGGQLENWELWRKILSRGGNIYARLVAHSKIHDLTSGFQCYSATLLKQYNLDAVSAVGFAFQMEMKIKAERLNLKIKEIPITFTRRTDGKSKISNNIIYEGLIVPWKFSPLLSMFKSKR